MQFPNTAGGRVPTARVIGAVAVSLVMLTIAGCGDAANGESELQSPETQSAVPRTAVTMAAEAVTSGLFDDSAVHNLAISFAQDDYDDMIATFSASSEKDWIDATVTIDGVTYADVGLRLKGNSSIMGLRRDGDTGRMGGGATADTPEALPWLVDLDRNVDGQNHEGIVEFVVRSNTSTTALNEAVALQLLEEAGLASQDAVAVRFSVNGSQPTLRLVIENPDDVWMAERFDGGGALYKAESTGDYSYRGDDPDLYDEVFDQEAGKDNADLTPLIGFLEFINNADEATFAAQLGDHLDIDAFASYLAMQELLANFDDIDGPGNNSYLYYDPKAGMFTVVPWDHNLAFGAMGAGMGGVRQPDGVQLPDGAQLPGGVRDAGGGQAPIRGGQPGGREIQPGGGANGAGRGMSRSNILVERFRANPEFAALYEQRLTELRAQLYGSGVAEGILEKWVSLLTTQASDLVDRSTIEREAAGVTAYFAAP